MINALTSSDITDAVRKAFADLPLEEQKIIYRIASVLIDNMKEKYPGAVFGPDSALELIACVGIAINDNRIRFVK